MGGGRHLGARVISPGWLTSGPVGLSRWKSLSSTETEKGGFGVVGGEGGCRGGCEWGLQCCLAPLRVDSGVNVESMPPHCTNGITEA